MSAYKIVLFICMQFIVCLLYLNFFKKRTEKFSNGFTSSHCHLNFILSLFCSPKALRILTHCLLHLLYPTLSLLLMSSATPLTASLHLPPSHFMDQSLTCYFLSPKTFPCLALNFSVQHTHPHWERSSGRPHPNRYNTIPPCTQGLLPAYHGSTLKVACLFINNFFTTYLSFRILSR